MKPYFISIKESFTSNFDVSVIMPFYKKIKEFKAVLPLNAKYFKRNGIEVIIVMDSPDDKEALTNFIQSYPFINWKIIVNNEPHGWRNPAPALNVGIRHASNSYLLICSPESEMLTDVIYLLRKTFSDYQDYSHYAYGRVCYVDQENVSYNNYDSFPFIPFGSIMIKRDDIERIQGYDESFIQWGGDDNNLRSRLDFIGIKSLHVEKAMMIHRDIDNSAGKKRRTLSIDKLSTSQLRHFFYPATPTPNSDDWGNGFNDLVYDYRHPHHSSSRIVEIAESLGLSNISVSKKYNPEQHFEKLLLVSCRNEETRITAFLRNMDKFFDGIIILDDGSEDNTFKLCSDEKILLKVKKVHSGFNDIENRNILLRLAGLFSHKLIFFFDVDEHLDTRISELGGFNTSDRGTAFLVPFINLWDDKSLYNSEYPCSIDGVCFRFKGFSSIGNSQIHSDKRLHFPQVPTLSKTLVCPNLLVLHYGFLTGQERKQKLSFYMKEDIDSSQSSYNHLTRHRVKLKKVADLNPDILQQLASRML